VAGGVNEPLLLTREQAAELCQVSLEILDQWSHEPGFPVIRRDGGHFVRIVSTLLPRWLEDKASTTSLPSKVNAPPARRRPRQMKEPPTSSNVEGSSRIRRLSLGPRGPA
jgi:hypothetical protein